MHIFSSVQFSHSVMSDSLRPHELQHAKPPCPSRTPGVHPNSCASSRWYHPAILSSVIPFSSCPQSLPAAGSFPVSQLFTWGVSALASVLPMNIQQIVVFIIFLNELLVNEALLCEITSVKKLITRTILNLTNQSSLLSYLLDPDSSVTASVCLSSRKGNPRWSLCLSSPKLLSYFSVATVTWSS